MRDTHFDPCPRRLCPRDGEDRAAPWTGWRNVIRSAPQLRIRVGGRRRGRSPIGCGSSRT
eukprot:8760656-Pyramimonas_sp.AAC.1